MNLCIKLSWLVTFISIISFTVVTIIYVTSDEQKYLTQCVVANVVPQSCYLIGPINATRVYIGEEKSCNMINRTMSCYIYNAVPNHKKISYTSLTTSKSLAKQHNYYLLYMSVIYLAYFTFLKLVVAIVCWYMSRKYETAQKYEELS